MGWTPHLHDVNKRENSSLPNHLPLLLRVLTTCAS
jgi:hypothetical protein